MSLNYKIETIFEKIKSDEDSNKNHAEERRICQSSRINSGFNANGEKVIHDGKSLNLWVEIVENYKSREKIRVIIYADIFDIDARYKVKEEIVTHIKR